MRAQFTRQFYLSEQFADRILTSYPLMVQRDLGNAISAMLRPREQEWFQARIEGWESIDKTSKAWLQWATGVQKRAMYDRHSQFVRATREGDQDYAAFGQTAITREMDMAERRLLYRCWHLKDTVWAETYNGSIGEIYRYWYPTRQEVCKLFPKTVSPNVKSQLANDPHVEVKCMHVVVSGEDYDRVPLPGGDKPPKYRTPWVSCYIDVENKVVLQENASYSRIYTLPRWATVSGSAFAYSPAAVAGLPGGRLLPTMTLSLMEVEYNGVLCDDTFEALMRVGAFGSQADIPSPLRGKQVKFTFESPLHQATDRKKGALFLQAGQMLTEAMQLDPTNAFQVDAVTALRDALEGIGVPATWKRDPKVAQQMADAKAKQDAIAHGTNTMLAGAQAAQALGEASKTLGGAPA